MRTHPSRQRCKGGKLVRRRPRGVKGGRATAGGLELRLKMSTLETDDLALWLALSEKQWIVPGELLSEVYHEFGSIAPLWQESNDYLTKIGMSEKSVSSL